jgi:hypothetical protein
MKCWSVQEEACADHKQQDVAIVSGCMAIGPKRAGVLELRLNPTYS